MSGWDNGLNQDYNGELGRWFANRLGAREQLRKDMIRMPAQHDTKNPPGVVCPTNQDKPLGYMIDDYKRCAKEPTGTTVTWTFTKTYTKEEWDALEVNESYDLVKEGYLQIMDEWGNSVGMDSLSLNYTIDK